MMPTLSPAKINTDLRITGRRDDGLHLLETTMTFINWGDGIHLSGRVDGKLLPRWHDKNIKPESELTMRAAKLLKSETNTRMGADITVIKKIPVGGGLGGGSSNAASALAGLNRLWRLKLKPDTLIRYAATLGSDVPFFLFGKTARVRGADGLQLRAATADKCFFLVAMPPVIAETARVYEMHDRIAEGKESTEQSAKEGADICNNNDLSLAAMQCYANIARAAEAVNNAAGRAGMSGSGAAIFAQFDDRKSKSGDKNADNQVLPGAPSARWQFFRHRMAMPQYIAPEWYKGLPLAVIAAARARHPHGG